jgi:hypothetical protein
MRYFLFLVSLVIVSCSQKKDVRVQKRPILQKQVSFVCNYTFNKVRCKKLYSDYKQSHRSEKEIRLVNFLKDSLLPCWYGTKWNFYGTTEEPGKGTIACGYFVTTVLRDAGLPVQRIRLAQCASEEMIKTICDKRTIHRYSNVRLIDFSAQVKNMGFGLYIVGLDNHTGFILNDGNESYFIHSTYVNQGCVINGKINGSVVLGSSKYRVIGKVKF